MRLNVVVATLGALCASQAQAQDPEMVRLEPASPWTLDYADDSCRLVRTFGAGEQEVTLGLTAYEPGGRFQLSAVGELTRTFRRPDAVTIALGDLEDFEVRYFQLDLDDRPGILITNPISIGPLPKRAEERLQALQPVESYSDPEAEAQVTNIGFTDGFEQEFVLETGSMREPMQALKSCNLELVSHWDFNLEAREGLSRIAVPKTPPFRWLRMRDLPRELRQPTLVNYRLMVDVEGKPTECRIAAAPPDSAFSLAACESLMDRATFDPALDADGNPVSYYFVFWNELR